MHWREIKAPKFSSRFLVSLILMSLLLRKSAPSCAAFLDRWLLEVRNCVIEFAASILALLIVATIIVEVLFRKSKSPEMRLNRQRAATWWLIVGVCLSVLLVGGWLLNIFVVGLVLVSGYELCRMLGIKITVFRVVLWLAVFLGYQLSIYGNTLYIFTFTLPFAFLILSILFFANGNIRNATILIFSTTSLLSVLAYSELSESQQFDAQLLLAFLFFATAINDIAQYVWGRLLGRHFIAPTLSPYKTLEGALGGVMTTSILCLFMLPKMIGVHWAKGLLFGMVLSTLGLLGDLFISRIKRVSKTKDSGRLLPGHGGLLDRVDSLLLTAPGFALCVLLG